jgi:hypothetical protein
MTYRSLYGDYGFREATREKSPSVIRREMEEAARAGIERSMKAGLAVAKANWPWLQHLRPQGPSG